MVSRTIEGAQTRVEGYNFDTRKHVVEYDDVINRQRETIYHERERILRSDDLAPTILAMLDEEVRALVPEHTAGEFASEWNRDGPEGQLTAMVPTLADRGPGARSTTAADAGPARPSSCRRGGRGLRARSAPRSARRASASWSGSSCCASSTRCGSSISPRSTTCGAGSACAPTRQRDPLNEFKVEAYRMFDELKATIRHDVTHTVFRRDASPASRAPAAPRDRCGEPAPDVTGAACRRPAAAGAARRGIGAVREPAAGARPAPRSAATTRAGAAPARSTSAATAPEPTRSRGLANRARTGYDTCSGSRGPVTSRFLVRGGLREAADQPRVEAPRPPPPPRSDDLAPLVTRFRDPYLPYEDLIVCERDCMRCSYAMHPRLRRQLRLLPAPGLLPVRQPGQGPRQERCALGGDPASSPW